MENLQTVLGLFSLSMMCFTISRIGIKNLKLQLDLSQNHCRQSKEETERDLNKYEEMIHCKRMWHIRPIPQSYLFKYKIG